ncbi:MAG: uracil-DNA glycosylase [Rickettsiaceae bacterium]|nr:uracil-DNA glycosylase [Rickettsiaceae bacterium]
MSTYYRLNPLWMQAMGLEDLFINSSQETKTQDVNIASAPKTITQEIASISKQTNNLDSKNIITKTSTATLKNITDDNYRIKEIKLDINDKGINNARMLANKASNLDELQKIVNEFNECDLKKASTRTVFADGRREARVMLIGEAPGATEDAEGIPFCGECGKLLDNIFASIGFSREKNLYISNTVFWRPPANRAPTQYEVEICKPFVEKHIALIKPQLLILVGSTAVSSLLGGNFQISKIRSNYYKYINQYLEVEIDCTAIFHPAYLLRQPGQKKATWHDLMQIKDYLIKAGVV